LNLAQSGVSHWCPMMTFLKRFGVPDARAPQPRAPRAAH